MRRDFASFFDKNVKSMSADALADALVDCTKFRDRARQDGDYIVAPKLDIMINHINAEIARRTLKVPP